MAPATSTVLDKVIRAATGSTGAAASDRELLRRFVDAGDQAAFAALFRRHAAMVLGVCRRVLSNLQDAEDACQATFLVLARRARSQRWQPSIANWLYSTARQVARNARVAAERRARREKKAAVREAVQPVDRMSGRELLDTLDIELDRLPPAYREPLVLCYLEGLSREEAAARLGVLPATIKTRLERGRKRLGDALTQRGCVAGAGLLALATSSPAEGPPLRLVETVLANATGMPSAAVAKLAGSVAARGLPKRTLIVALVLLGAGAIGVGAVLLQPPAERPPVTNAASTKAPGPEPGPNIEKPKPVLKVTGRVIDPDGKPVAGARLLIPATDSPGDDKPVELARSAGDGSFQCAIDISETGKSDECAIHACAPGFAADWVRVREAVDKPITLQLVRDDVPARGRVVDLEGKPVPGAVITVKSIRPTISESLEALVDACQTDIYARPQGLARGKTLTPACAEVAVNVVTDKDGRFEIKHVGRGRILCLCFQANRCATTIARVITLPGIDPKAVTRSPPASPAKVFRGIPVFYGPEFTHVAKPDAVIKGNVTDAKTGKPVAGAQVTGQCGVEDAWAENLATTTTGADGRYRLTGLTKSANRVLKVEGAADSPCLPANQFIPDAAGLAETTIDVRLARGVMLKGRITDKETGKTIPGASVVYAPLAVNGFFEATPVDFRFVKTNREGFFQLAVLPGAGLITARQLHGPGSRYSYTQARLRPADEQWIDKEKRASMGEVFEIAAGYTTLFGSSAYKIIEPADGTDSVELEMQFDPGKSISGKVVDASGKPAAGVAAYGLEAFIFPDSRPGTLTDGTFTALALDPQRPRLTTFVDSDRKLSASIRLRGDEKEPPVIKLQPWATVTGRLVDSAGKPCPGLGIRNWVTDVDDSTSQGFSNSGTEAKTDTDGRFQLGVPFTDSNLRLGLLRNGNFLETPAAFDGLKLRPGETRSLGDIVIKLK